MSEPPTLSPEAVKILQLLRDRHNVLIAGPPASGKSRLLKEVANGFMAVPSAPVHVPGAAVAIPARPPVASIPPWLPSPNKSDRKIYRTVFHQNTKYRDFVCGLVPQVASASTQATAFKVVMGKLYAAATHAGGPDGAALLIIDEINRGPAVQAFGGSIVAIESDKRLAPSGESHAQTEFFDVLDADGNSIDIALPHCHFATLFKHETAKFATTGN